ncbi:MAG: transcriptional regulator [Methanobacteriota archaeon]|nr:MAG: transcriptional regulator [Euryarchaeota archaeon]
MAVPRFWREMPVRYNLIGSHCTGCDMYHYPPRAMCSGCHRESLGKMEEHQFAGTGQVVACTVVYQPQQGYEMHGPYPMAIIEMDEGARITAQIVDVAPEMVKRGMRVKAVFRKLGEDSESGIIYYGTKFTPVEELEPEEEDEESADSVEAEL